MATDGRSLSLCTSCARYSSIAHKARFHGTPGTWLISRLVFIHLSALPAVHNTKEQLGQMRRPTDGWLFREDRSVIAGGGFSDVSLPIITFEERSQPPWRGCGRPRAYPGKVASSFLLSICYLGPRSRTSFLDPPTFPFTNSNHLSMYLCAAITTSVTIFRWSFLTLLVFLIQDNSETNNEVGFCYMILMQIAENSPRMNSLNLNQWNFTEWQQLFAQ